jgi:integrase
MPVSDAMRRIRMSVFKPARSPFYKAKWIVPATGFWTERSTKKRNRRDAYSVASEWAEEIIGGRRLDAMSWGEFCDLYKELVNDRREGRAGEPWRSTKAKITEYGEPRFLNDVTTLWVTKWQEWMRSKELATNTIASHSARLKAALNWAVRQELIPKAPQIRVQVEDAPRSRAITLEEFERILEAVPKIRNQDAAAWNRLLRGQWHCGFRISEVVRLSWDLDAPIHIDDSGRYPVVCLAAKANKARKWRIRPISPEFWAVCSETPKTERHGYVFPLKGRRGQMSIKAVIRTISEFGEKAGVITNPETKKLATSHDTRRGFAVQMDTRGLTLAELQKWMDHSSIKTTLTYYRTAEANDLAEKVWGRKTATDQKPQTGQENPSDASSDTPPTGDAIPKEADNG